MTRHLAPVALLCALLCAALYAGPARGKEATDPKDSKPAARPADAKSASPATRPTGPATRPAPTPANAAPGTAVPPPPLRKAEAPAKKDQPKKDQPKTDEPKKDTAATADDRFPSPAELMEKIRSQRAEADKLPKVAHVDLDQALLERSPELTLFGDFHLLTVPAILDRLHKARDDKSLRAVLVTMSGDSNFNTAQAMEIRAALTELRKAGKKTFVFADSYDTTAYLAASAATDVCLLEGGELQMQGVTIEPMFLRGLFDKVGIKADFVQIGEFKGADEMYTRTELSPEARGELGKIADGLYDVILDTVVANRNLPRSAVKQAIDDVFTSAKAAKAKGFVDHLISQDALRDLLAKELGDKKVNLLAHYGVPKRDAPDFSSPFAILQMMTKKPTHSNKPAVALIHAEGVIVDGEAEDGLLGGGGNVGAENLRKAFRVASKDPNVKAIVLRIDSPGGSALASEVMWQSVHRAALDKPVVVSVGSMAASGGYYLASAGDYIFADPSAIVGSIGVVGGKFVLEGIFDKLGITTEAISRGQNADLFSMSRPWTDRQRRLVTNWMKATYEQFTERVMTNRKGKIKDIEQVARGRIFVARQALELGMIDEIGGLTEAIKFAAADVDLKEGAYEVRMVPESRSVLDLLSGNVGPDAEARMPFHPRVQVTVDSPLKLMPASLRRSILEQLQIIQVMDKRPVMLVAPCVVKTR